MSGSDCIEEFYQYFSNLNFERSRRFGASDYDPAHLREMLGELGSPQLSYKTIHVAGTVAKGSVAHYLSRMLTASGKSCGLYSSPHLEKLNERIAVDGKEISNEEFCLHWEHLRKLYHRHQNLSTEENVTLAKGRLSFFDALTAIAFLYFQKRGVGFGVMETGLGGRRDSTNNLSPEFCVITPVDLDHCGILGDTIEKIAYEKAGILRPGVPVYSYPQPPGAERVIRDEAKELGSPLEFIEAPQVAGDLNFAICQIIYERHFGGKAPEIDTVIRGRFEKISNQPELYFDLAHNPRAMRFLAQKILQSALLTGKNLRLYLNCMKERDPLELLGAFFEELERHQAGSGIELSFLNHRQAGELHVFTTESVAALQTSPQASRTACLAKALQKARVIETEEEFGKMLRERSGALHLVAGSSRLYGVWG